MNLKHIILLFVFASLSILGFSQTTGKAFYIYRNDGQFNAFFCNEVDSLGYSNYDANGILHDEPVMQIIYTPDSIYRIPLEVIDSVGLEKPEIKYNPKVVKMKEKGLMDYLMSIDGMTLYFNSNMPKIIRPLEDDVLVYLDFDNDFFPDGFAGKVKDVRISSNAYVVECDSIYDITDIYEQLIFIERLGSTSSEDNRKKVSGEWISSRNPISVEIGFDQDSCKINGAVNGTYIATIACNITKENQYINLRVNHDWNISANFIFQQKTPETPEKESEVFNIFTGRIPQIPIFLFKIDASKLRKIEGSVDLNASFQSPAHSYLTEVNFRNGKIIGNTSKISAEGQGVSNFDKSISFALDGSIQIGAKLFIGLETVNFLKSYLQTGFDVYVGPKLTGNVNFNVGTGNDNVNDYYTILKDSNVGLNWCSVDIDVVGEASFMGHHFNRKVFASAALTFAHLYHEWYIMPDFSELQIEKDQEKLSATINCTPTKDVLFPLSLGIGLYDDEGKLKELAFDTHNYKHENEGYVIRQEFSMLEREKKYEAKPMIKFMGGEIPAFPTKKFIIENGISVRTLGYSILTNNSANVSGKIENFNIKLDDGEVGFIYNDSGYPTIENSIKVYVGKLSYFNDEEFITELSGLEYGKTYYYCTYLYNKDGYKYGNVLPLNTKNQICPDERHSHMVDLGLPSGTKWACCNVGASSPSEIGGFYAYGETTEKTNYDHTTCRLYNDKLFEAIVNAYEDISGTDYDVAYVQWGSKWCMPSKDLMEELIMNCECVQISYGGTTGSLVIGKNGNSIFLPAAGFRVGYEHADMNRRGSYWSSTYYLRKSDQSEYYFDSPIMLYSKDSLYLYDLSAQLGLSVRPIVRRK